MKGLPKSPGEEKTVPAEKDGDDDDEILRFPPPFLVPDDPKGHNIGFENDGEEDYPSSPERDDYPSNPDKDDYPSNPDGDDYPSNPDGDDYPSNPEDSPKHVSKDDSPTDDSSGFREELDDRPDYNVRAESMDSGVIEQELEQEDAQIAESVPTGPNNFIVPPLYTMNRKESRNFDRNDEFYSDMLGEAREDFTDHYENQGFENDMMNTEREESTVARSGDSPRNEMSESLLEKTERYEDISTNQTESNFRENMSDEVVSLEQVDMIANREDVNSSHLTERSQFLYDRNEDYVQQVAQPSYPHLPEANDTGNAPRVLPTPGVSYVKQEGNDWENAFISETNSYNSDARRFSQSTAETGRFGESIDRVESLSLPSPDIGTVNTRQVELTLPRTRYEATHTQNSENFSSMAEQSIMQKSDFSDDFSSIGEQSIRRKNDFSEGFSSIGEQSIRRKNDFSDDFSSMGEKSIKRKSDFSEDFSPLGEKSIRRKSASLIADETLGEQIREIRPKDDENLSISMSREDATSKASSSTLSAGQFGLEEKKDSINNGLNVIDMEQRKEGNQRKVSIFYISTAH